MVWFISKKDNDLEQIVTKPIKQYVDLSSLNEIKARVDDEIKKSFDYAHFEAINATDDEGGYYGREFNLGGSAGKLKSLYLKEPWVYATASLIAKKLAMVPFVAANPNTNEPIPNHEINALLDKGNPIQDGLSLNWAGYVDLILGGNFFRVFDDSYTTPFHIPVELANIRLKDNQEWALSDVGPYDKLEISGSMMGLGISQGDFDWQQVVHHKLPNPFNPFYGLSMILAAARPILLDRHKNEFEMAFYLRGATNAGVVETEQDISKSRMDRLMRTFEQAFTGKRNWWRTLFLPKGAKWVNSGLTMSEMQHLEGLRENRLTLLAVMGVPPSQVGITEDVNRATSETQERALWHNTVVPLAYFIAAGWNNSWIVKQKYKGKIKVIPDFAEIDAVTGSIFYRAEQARALDDIAIINEQRTMVGLPPLKDTDPRGSMMVSEMRSKGTMSALFADDSGTENQEDLGPDTDGSNAEKAIVITNTDDGDGKERHVHMVEIDNESGNGITVSTQGNGPDHKHAIEKFKVQPGGDDMHAHPPITPLSVDDVEKMAYAKEIKKSAVDSQERIEKKQSSKYLKLYQDYINLMLDQAKKAIEEGQQIRGYLFKMGDIRRDMFMLPTQAVLAETMKLAFKSSQRNTKGISNRMTDIEQKALPISMKAPRFDPIDEEAIDVIAEKTEKNKRKILADRGIKFFYKFDEANTEKIEQLVEDGLKAGKTFEQIQTSIKKEFTEKYFDQFFTIARTETLTAVSVGLEWHHETLKEVFSEVNKQWIHIGDATILGGNNADARNEHAKFEFHGKGGIVPSDYVWVNPETGGQLRYPRDVAGGAADVINCRCSMIDVIPPSATSNASAILRNQ